MAQAEWEGSNFIIANDPDADRMAIAERKPDGTWKIFTGDETGTIFAYYLFNVYKDKGEDVSKLAVVASTVSSKFM